MPQYPRAAIHIFLKLLLCAWFSGSHAFSDRVNKVVAPIGTYFGVYTDYAATNYSFKGVPQQIGIEPASYTVFTQIPLDKYDKGTLEQVLVEVCIRGVAVILTVQPLRGLDAITDASIIQLVDQIVKYENKGATVIVRFAHEMNGSWYPWGQQPLKYTAAFRRIANVLKKRTKRATMMWGPNVGPGYPYAFGNYQYNCTNYPLDCKELDTNGDGNITALDDMFSPYWPGDEYVDWVGTSLYWWGKSWPWGENEVPNPEYFSDTILGKVLADANIPDVKIPDFYTTYAKNKDKAMVITETAAMYNECDNEPNYSECKANANAANPPSELELKSAWWKQVFSLDGDSSVRVAFPNIKLISWFNVRTLEAGAGNNTVDWTISHDAAVKTAFNQHLSVGVPVNGVSLKFWLTGADLRQRLWGGLPTKPLGKRLLSI